MNAVTQFDVGPLNWVKNEIDLALGRADQALQRFAEAGEGTQLKFCRTHLHQVQGALTIVGLDGVTQFAEGVEALLEALESGKVAADAGAIELTLRSLATIGSYLDELVGGEPNQPLRLLSIYREVQAARGLPRVAASDLFFPDLSVSLPAPPSPRKALTHAELQGLLRHERPRFQRGFLAWLRSPQERAGISEMRSAVKRIEETQETASARAFWWVAGSFLGALGEGALPADADAKQLCARIDLQIRRLFEGSHNVAERLLRDALYQVGSAAPDCVAVQGVRDAYQLPALIPSSETLAPAPREAVRRRLRELIAATEESWNRYCVGTPQALPVFRENADALALVVDELVNTDYRRLAQAIAAAAHWLADDSSRRADALAMEVATAILLAQNVQEDLRRLGGDFAHQVDVTVARIHGCFSGNAPAPEAETPLLDEMSRRAQEKLLVAQVAKEIQSNLGQIEQVLDGFFRDAERRSELASLDVPLHQVAGALAIMRHDGAVTAVRDCAEQIKRFTDADYEPQQADFERVANQLSLIGFFIDSLAHGATDFASFVAQMQPKVLAAPDASTTPAPRASVEQELAQQKLDTHALLGALKEQPDDQALREEIKQNLSALKSDAELVADRALGEQTKAMLSMLDKGEDGARQIDAAMATLKPSPAEALAPSAQTVHIAQGSRSEVDAELLGIFLEEAHEVLVTIADALGALRQQPHQRELLTTIRRAFHTLKGSGRMVGLHDLGEAAWSIEQTLNLWLQQELEVGAALLDLLGQAHALFAAWVDFLEQRLPAAPDASALRALAEALRRGGDESVDAAPSPVFTAASDDAPPSARIISFPAALPPGAPDERAVGTPEPEPEPAPAATDRQPRIIISPVLFDIFSDEARAHLLTLRTQLSVLEADRSASTPHEMYRAAHTLAGISATVGIASVNQLGLALEHALLRRDQSLDADSASALGVVAQVLDDLEGMLAALAVKQEFEPRTRLVAALEALYPVRGLAPEVVADDAAPPAVPQERLELETAAVAAQVPQLDDDIDEQLLPIFLEEALDLSQGISTALRSWRHAPADHENVDTLKRLLHTLKGSARMAGAMKLGEITHAIESRVGQAAGAGGAAADVIDEIDTAFDAVLHIIERLQGGESLTSPAPAGLAESPEFTDAIDSTAAATSADVADIPHDASVALESAAVDEHRVVLEHDAETAPAGDAATAPRAMLRVRADLIDSLVNEAGELSIARARIEGEMRGLKGSLLDLTENVIRLRGQLREIEIQSESQIQSRSAEAEERHAGFDPLEFDRFTRFQELTRMMAESVNDVATVQQSLLKNLDDANSAILAQARLNRDLQQQLMGARMVPFGTLAERLYRTVRQTSKAVGKRADLEISGSQVELDRSVLDKISAPLEHLLRNAVVHGLEAREIRVAQGKPAIGGLVLALKQEGNEVILTLADDGGGLDFAAIRERALTAGLLGEGEEADNARLAELIFSPGFSTASVVSQVAGRGVGMDVVKTEIARLGGRVEVHSTAGQGTEFCLYIPLTLALTKALLVRVGNRRYAIPSAMIEQVLDLKDAALARIRDAGGSDWMGRHYPFHYLPHLLGEPAALPEVRRQYWVLLLASGTRRIAVQVDELLGNEEIVVKNIGPQLARVVGIDGATVLASGQVVLIVNPVALSARAAVGKAVVPLPTPPMNLSPQRPAGEGSAIRAPTVMVVDDSLTVRKITGRLLAREGYQVKSAKDGVDALEQLLDVVPDVLLVDIEMPRMDGFDLTRNVRADERLKNIPIIMITSRIAEKHRAYAFEIGVNDYLGKPYQEDELLGLLRFYVKAGLDA